LNLTILSVIVQSMEESECRCASCALAIRQSTKQLGSQAYFGRLKSQLIRGIFSSQLKNKQQGRRKER
jgi:hypothetical protein